MQRAQSCWDNTVITTTVITDKCCSKRSYLFKEIKVDAVSLLFSNKEIPLLETSRDSSDIHWARSFKNYKSFVVHCKDSLCYLGKRLNHTDGTKVFRAGIFCSTVLAWQREKVATTNDSQAGGANRFFEQLLTFTRNRHFIRRAKDKYKSISKTGYHHFISSDTKALSLIVLPTKQPYDANTPHKNWIQRLFCHRSDFWDPKRSPQRFGFLPRYHGLQLTSFFQKYILYTHG